MYDNAVKTSPIKSSAIDVISTGATLQNQESEYLRKLADLNEKINMELVQQKSTRITIYNLEAKINGSISRVRKLIKQKEQIQSDMIKSSQFQPKG